MSKSSFRFPVPKQVIAKYSRDKKGAPTGLVAAIKDEDGNVSVGWCLTSRGDKFNRNVAWAAVVGRSKVGTAATIPRTLDPIVDEIVERASRYFRVPVDKVMVAQPVAGK